MDLLSRGMREECGAVASADSGPVWPIGPREADRLESEADRLESETNRPPVSISSTPFSLSLSLSLSGISWREMLVFKKKKTIDLYHPV